MLICPKCNKPIENWVQLMVGEVTLKWDTTLKAYVPHSIVTYDDRDAFDGCVVNRCGMCNADLDDEEGTLRELDSKQGRIR